MIQNRNCVCKWQCCLVLLVPTKLVLCHLQNYPEGDKLVTSSTAILQNWVSRLQGMKDLGVFLTGIYSL